MTPPASPELTALGFKLHHVGVAVPALGPATEQLCALFGYRIISGPFDDPIQRVSVSFLTTSPDDTVELELIAPLTDDSPIKSILGKGGSSAYHFCFETADIEKAVEHAVLNGCMVVQKPVPAVAFEGRRIAWIFSKARQLFELVESKPA